MKKMLILIRSKVILAGLILCLLTISCGDQKPASGSGTLISEPGQYEGYSEAIYADDFDISSQYIEMRDGVKLAVDIYRPKDKKTGKVIKKKLPVLLMHTPYNRRYNNPKKELTVDLYAGTASRLIKYGYVLCTADFRGLFASYGNNQGYNRGEWIGSARYDAYDIVEWLAKQPWSNGNIGMWGCSATGGSQMQAATTAPPSLKAMFPMSFEFDVVDFRIPGGISAARGGAIPPKPGARTQQEIRDAAAAPVDNDTDSTLLKAAIAEHAGTIESEGPVPFRDSFSETFTDEFAKQWWIKSSPSSYLDQINASGIAMYMAVNWDEGHTKPGPFFAINNFTIPRKMIIGPGHHCDWVTSENLTGFDIVVEERRFFDYWLKGIDNGIMNEDPVYYYTYNAPKGAEWKSANKWPLPEETRVNFYLAKGTLTSEMPTGKNQSDQTTVNYDLRQATANSGKLVYETAPLERDIQVTGHPSIKLWVSSTATDGDFVATVSDVAPDGTLSSYNIHGQLRASMRKVSDPPYDYNGLPWRRFYEDDAQPLEPGIPAELDFALLPISMIFKAGHKIQLAITFSSGFATPRLDPAPKVTIYRDEEHASYLTLPVIEQLQ